MSTWIAYGIELESRPDGRLLLRCLDCGASKIVADRQRCIRAFVAAHTHNNGGRVGDYVR